MKRDLLHNIVRALELPRWRWALVIALLSDALGFGVVFAPPVQWVVDVVTFAALWAVLGFRWALLVSLGIEAIPFLQVFPAWTLVVATLASLEKHPSADGSGPGRGASVNNSAGGRCG